jgi:hypothetical protein
MALSMTLSSSRNIKRIYLVATAILIIVLVYQITREEALLQPNQQLEQLLSEQPPLVADPVFSPLLANANSELERAQRTLQSATAKEPEHESARANESTAMMPDAWRMADASSATPSMPLPDAVSIYEPVSVDMDSFVYPDVGQQTSVALPGGERLQVNVKASSANPNGDYTWRGHLDGYGDEYPVVMTYGSSSVFATVTTPNGSYTLESVNGSGWIYKNPSEFELTHPGKNDYLEIPHDH